MSRGDFCEGMRHDGHLRDRLSLHRTARGTCSRLRWILRHPGVPTAGSIAIARQQLPILMRSRPLNDFGGGELD
jgi:hypothetical protein